jgi:hypothetical protein
MGVKRFHRREHREHREIQREIRMKRLKFHKEGRKTGKFKPCLSCIFSCAPAFLIF